LSTTDTDGSLEFVNNNKKAVDLPFVADGANFVAWGDDKALVDLGRIAAGTIKTGMAFENAATCTGAANADECDGFLFTVTTSGGEVELFELTGIEETGTVCDIKGVTNKAHEYLDEVCSGAVIDTALGDIKISINATGNRINFTQIDLQTAPGTFETSGSGTLKIRSLAANNLTVNLKDNDGLGADGQTVKIKLDATNDIDFESNIANVTELTLEDNSDYTVGIDDANWGTFFKINTDSGQSIEIEYPEEQIIADVYISPASATATAAKSGAVNINFINAATGISRTDIDFASAVPTKNVILIGGPNVNQLVNDLATAGDTWTADKYTADTAIVQQIVDAYGTNDALVIAGYAAKDTALAGKVVASKLTQNQFAADMVGTLVEISTTGASTVNEVTFA
jgi:hypothetical protein